MNPGAGGGPRIVIDGTYLPGGALQLSETDSSGFGATLKVVKSIDHILISRMLFNISNKSRAKSGICHLEAVN